MRPRIVPIGLVSRAVAIVDQKRPALPVPFAVELAGPDAQGALLRPGLLRDGVRAALAAGLADGVPARGDPGAARLRRVRDSSTSPSSWCAPTTWASARSRTPAATAASRSSRVAAPATRGFTCPFHGWCYGLDGKNTACHARTDVLRAQPRTPTTSTSCRCSARRGAGARGSTSTPTRRRCAQCIEPYATILDGWKVESLRPEWWYACRLPVNWKLAQARSWSSTTSSRRTRSSASPAGTRRATGATFDPRAFVDADIHYLRTMSDGMAGMVHADDVRIAEGLRDIELPADAEAAIPTWQHALNDAVVRWHRDAGHDIPDLNDLEARGAAEPMALLLPALLRVADVQQRVGVPLPPARAGGDVDGDLVARRDSREGDERGKPTPPEPWECDDPRWPPIPAQDFSNLPRQQRGLHAKGFEYMRLSERLEGGISNFERMVDGFLAGLPYEKLLPALQSVNVNPLVAPIADLGF